MSDLELRSRSAELLHTSEEVALGAPLIVYLVRRHDHFCDLLRLRKDSPFRTGKRDIYVDAGISLSLTNSDISDRILSCREAPAPVVVDLAQEIPLSECAGSAGITSAPMGGTVAPPEEADASINAEDDAA